MISVCEPVISRKELEYVTNCIKTNWISSKGKYIQEFENKFAKFCGCKYGISTTSGTAALHLALATLGIGKDDEVIIPTFTMIATAFAVIYTGAKPVLVDADKETWCMDISQIEDKITKKTKAILPVHIYGHPCNMSLILKLAKKYKLYVVEDAAEAHGAEYKGRKVGGIGDIGCFSFYANKIITTGEGGMIVTNNKKIAEKAKLLKNLAFSLKKRFLHFDIGFNYRMTNIQAAIGLAQLERIKELVNAHRRNAGLYNKYLRDIKSITLPVEEDWAKNIYWMFGILIEKDFGKTRDRVIVDLFKRGIETRIFFIPIHKQPIFRKMNLFLNECYPVSEELSKKGLYLPSGSGLEEKEIKYIAKSIKEIKNG